MLVTYGEDWMGRVMCFMSRSVTDVIVIIASIAFLRIILQGGHFSCIINSVIRKCYSILLFLKNELF